MSEKTKHVICLDGCDDYTEFEMELTNEEYEFLRKLAKIANTTSTYSCMPRLLVDGDKCLSKKILAKRMKDGGWSLRDIAKNLDLPNESSVISLLDSNGD